MSASPSNAEPSALRAVETGPGHFTLDKPARSRAVRRKVHSSNPPPTPPEPGRLALTVPETAWSLHCSVSTVWELIRSQELASFKLRRRRFVALTEVQRFVSEGGTDG
jgi:excisionase family DNA binding protein